ncbi:MAG: SpoIIE family protein phosphatase [Bacteroidetes bacterium]|nr:SpoIIE family protein phosphatase [Bacteroidota bacterium]
MTSSLINLESLLELSARLNESSDEDFILNSALLTLMGKLRIVRASILLPNSEQTEFTVILAKGRTSISSLEYFEVKVFRELANAGGEGVLRENKYHFVMPLCHQNNLLAVICLGKPFGLEFSDEEQHYASLVSVVAANALQNARSIQSLLRSKTQIEQRNQLVTAMFEMSREFSTLLSREQIIKLFSYRLMGQTMVSRFSMFILKDGVFEQIIHRLNVDIPQEYLWEFAGIQQSNITQYIPSSDEIKEFTTKNNINVVSQMMIQGEVKGVLVVGKKLHGGLFLRDDISFIEALGNTALSALENARLFQEEINKKRLETEINLAHEIQMKLLPANIPHFEGYDLAAVSISSKQVGGDYYDFIRLSEVEMLVAIADVSGKGMPASLLMANVQAALRALAPLRLELPELTERINSIVYQNTGADKFITFFCGIINNEDSTFRYVNAGHNPPILLRKDNSIIELREGGIILGILDFTPPYKQGKITFENDDVLLLYTDGVSEAMNLQNVEFSEESTAMTLREFKSESANEIVKNFIKTVQSHAGDAPQSDDITLAVVKRC